MNYSNFNQHGIVDGIADGAYHALHLLHRNLVNLPGRKIVHHDLAILNILVIEGPMPASDLAGRLSLTRPQITQFIDRLEGKGAVSRKSDDRDRRRVRVEITDKGRSILAGYRRTVRYHIAEKLEKLEPGQADALAQSLAQVIEITRKLAQERSSDD
ncbi:MAG: MarR family transcriptional regulator [Dehalococcoidales bacterium]|nr:MarR family transcriptional regulator [Dehalococcoidales bacterium]